MTTPTTVTPHDPAILYAAVEGRMASLGAGEAVFFDTATGQSQVMTAEVAHAFGLCQTFLPMHEHVLRVMDAIPALKGQGAAVQKVLEMLVARGLMLTDAQFLERFSAPQTKTEQVPVSGLFLRAPTTTDRLQTALDALAGHLRRFPFAHPIHVIDLTADAGLKASHAAAIEAFSSATGNAVRHISAAVAARVIDSLVTALPDAGDALRWLLSSDGPGAARNLAALLAAGTRYLFLDADTALPLRLHPEYGPGLAADARALAVRSFASSQAALSAGSEPQDDPLAAHLAVCGASVAQALAHEPQAAIGPDSVRGVAAARMPQLEPHRRVAFTAVGRVGAFALTDPTLPFKLSSEARAGMTASREAYLASYREPSLWSGTNRYAVGLGERLTPLAFDAGQLVPCTLPAADNAAALQLELLRLAHAEATDFAFPHALAQIDPGLAAHDGLGRPDMAQCLSGLAAVVAQDLYATGPAARLDVMAAKLADLAGGSQQTLETYLTEYLSWYRSDNIEQMQRAMTLSPPPVYWLADLRTAVETQSTALIKGEIPRLAGWPADLDTAACVARFRTELEGLAAGLRAWPAAFELARRHGADWRHAIAA